MARVLDASAKPTTHPVPRDRFARFFIRVRKQGGCEQSNAKPAFPNFCGLKSVFEKLCCRNLQNRRIRGAESETRYTSEEREHLREARVEKNPTRASRSCITYCGLLRYPPVQQDTFS